MWKKLLKRKHKKWEELSQAEKLEYLKLEQDYPWAMQSIYMLFLLMIVAVLVFGFANQTKMLNDLYNMTGHNITNETSAYINENAKSAGEAMNGIGIGIFAIFILWIYGLFRWHRRQNKFNKSIKLKEA